MDDGVSIIDFSSANPTTAPPICPPTSGICAHRFRRADRWSHSDVCARATNKRAELAKLQAETDKIRAEAEKIRAEFQKVDSRNGSRVRLLFAAANPLDFDRLRLDVEIRGIAQGIRESRHKRLLELDQLWCVRWADLRTHLLRETPDILHFSGFATEDGLVFENNTGSSGVIPIEQVEGLFALFADRIRLVVLNANDSNKFGDRLAKTIECVVGMEGPITDDDAASFSAAFYEAISDGKTIKTLSIMVLQTLPPISVAVITDCSVKEKLLEHD